MIHTVALIPGLDGACIEIDAGQVTELSSTTSVLGVPEKEAKTQSDLQKCLYTEQIRLFYYRIVNGGQSA